MAAYEWLRNFNVSKVKNGPVPAGYDWITGPLSLLHRDKLSGGVPYFDCLLTIGGDDGTVLALPGLGIRYQYTSGTMVLFSGHTRLHGVSKAHAERVCFAAYVRQSVHRLFRIHIPELPSAVHSKEHMYWLGYIQEILKWARKE